MSFHIGGNSSNKSGGADGSSWFKLPLIICVFSLLSLLQNLIKHSDFQKLIPKTTAHKLFCLIDSCTTSEEVSNEVVYLRHNTTRRGLEEVNW
jgi:hypothetical protein